MSQFKYVGLIEADLHPRQILARLANAILNDCESGSPALNEMALENWHKKNASVSGELTKIADELDKFEPMSEYHALQEELD